ncbi:transcriptional regulator, AraC family [Methylobacterium sp. 4-46]|uniref:helix-turn-helix domain-containing protein n=1 Tax=unclassified Methylobacterium TaxID=2615210 RepID=UPI000165C73C|nr:MULTISPECIES: AraC family transcriptional regulator [Methylobacterium]ACA16206.1 transcriptional regulator, AraC family [Methylobacterium sp. 4-46]WFT81913.1 AraC family transcriptional regulator [Methylobacterium nodulans]
MRLTILALPAPIRPWIHQMWIFESPCGLPASDLRVVVPNGRAKLIVPWRNGLTAEGGGRRRCHAEGDAVLIGQWDAPTVISSAPVPTVSIGVEFTPAGLSRFLTLPLGELTQAIEPVGNVLGRSGDRLRRRLAEAASAEEAARVLRAFLVARCLATDRRGPGLADEALRLMAASGYRMDVATLEARTGYSRRHLAAVFRRDVGLAPKRLGSVLAFEQLYRAFSRHGSAERLRDDALDRFCDQSHFIRQFRRFAGIAPGRFAELGNEFGQIFYRAPEGGPASQTSNP